MADKRLDNENLFFAIILIILLCALLALSSCASQAKTYPCPIGHSISMEKIKKDIRAKNNCPVCGADFPYLAEEKKSGGYSFGYRPYYPWPRVWVYSYSTTRFHSYQHHGR